MDEQLNQSLSSMITTMTEAAQKAGEFSAAQMPEVVEQLISVSIVSYWFYAAVFGVFMIAAIVCGIIYFLDNYNDGAVIFGIIFGAIGASGIMYTASHLFRLYIAPKVWLIEYAANLIK